MMSSELPVGSQIPGTAVLISKYYLYGSRHENITRRQGSPTSFESPQSQLNRGRGREVSLSLAQKGSNRLTSPASSQTSLLHSLHPLIPWWYSGDTVSCHQGPHISPPWFTKLTPLPLKLYWSWLVTLWSWYFNSTNSGWEGLWDGRISIRRLTNFGFRVCF